MRGLMPRNVSRICTLIKEDLRHQGSHVHSLWEHPMRVIQLISRLLQLFVCSSYANGENLSKSSQIMAERYGASILLRRLKSQVSALRAKSPF